MMLASAAVTGLCGLLAGLHLQDRRYRKLLHRMQIESGDQSLQLLETRKHLRTLASHLKMNLSKDQTIRHLKQKQRSLLTQIDQHSLQARRKEKEHYIETANIKLELIETKIALNKLQTSANRPEQFIRTPANDVNHISSDLQILLRNAGIQKVHQIAALSRHDIDRLAGQRGGVPAK